MPTTLIVLDHPCTLAASENVPHNRSCTAAIAKRAIESARSEGHDVDVIDLHADGFNPVMTGDDLVSWRTVQEMDPLVADYQRRLLQADRIVLAFPVWWELKPALTTGFIDRVCAKNVLYTQPGKGRFHRLLKKDVEVVAVTFMSTPKGLYCWLFHRPVVSALRWGICWKIGIKRFRWIPITGVERTTAERRARMLADFAL